MKSILINIFLFVFLTCPSVLGNVYFKEYIIYTSGIKIGELNWEVVFEKKNYSNIISLKSGGLLSAIYNFEGDYFSSGNISNNILSPNIYKHKWKTSKVNKKMELVFNDIHLESLKQSPAEKENLRVNIYKITKAKDPLSSFLQIIFGKETSLVIDGRRLYTMSSVSNKNKNKTTIEIANYSNLWADHKRSQFEKIIFEKNNDDFLPSKIIIFFDGRLFNLK